MRYLLILLAVALPIPALADCTGLTMTPCLDADLQRIEQRSATYGQNWHVFEPPPPVPSVEDLDRVMPARDPRAGLSSDDWTFYRTPNGTYTNFGHGWIVGPDGSTNVPY